MQSADAGFSSYLFCFGGSVLNRWLHQKHSFHSIHHLLCIRKSHTRCSRTLADLLNSRVGRNLQEEHIHIFGALCDAKGGGVDIEHLWADLGLAELLQISVIEVIRLDCRNDTAYWVSTRVSELILYVNSPTRLDISGTLSSFLCLVACRQI